MCEKEEKKKLKITISLKNQVQYRALKLRAIMYTLCNVTYNAIMYTFMY